MKIADGLLLRKQFAEKVAQLTPIKKMGEEGLFQTQTRRINITEQIDEVILQVPHVTIADVTQEYDYYATELRKLDAAIQKANWSFDLDYNQQGKPGDIKARKRRKDAFDQASAEK